MKKVWLLLVAVLVLTATAAVASAASPAGKNGDGAKHVNDNLKHPRGEKQARLREKAIAMKLAGKADGKVVKVAKGQFVELVREDEDLIFTILGEFGTATNTTHHSHAGGAPGPLHNQIPAPNRLVDNTTIWQPDFSQSYYENMLFDGAPGAASMRNLYIEMSSNRYTVDGDVTDWVGVPYNARSYGSNYCGGVVCQDTWRFVNDSADAWYQRALTSMTGAQIDAYLAKFDVWDRYDHDGDGNFDEADGYIDHFQSVHAGEGEETGGGAQGADAIWSHRWYAYFSANGPDGTGPGSNPIGGLRIGNSSYWIGDYTAEPENGGVGVFAHEFAHDLGLPDLYDISGGENSTAWWTLMSQGSYGTDGQNGLGTHAIPMGAWEKFQLGWLNYEVAFWGQKSEHKLGPANANTKQAQAVITVLPPGLNPTTIALADPPEGNNAWWSTMGNNIETTMSRLDVQVPAAPATLSMQVWYEIEQDFDYAYVEVSTNGGTTWTPVQTSRSTTTDPNGVNEGFGITGDSGAWVPLTADLSAYAGQTIGLRLRYKTDAFVVGRGFLADAITLGSFFSGAENPPEGWTLNGFVATDGDELRFDNHYYIAEYRQYQGWDAYLRTSPYNFSYLARPDFVDFFPYQDGLLVTYWDTGQADNDTSVHPGQGLILPIDSHPAPLIRGDGNPWRCRVQSYDSTFTQEPTDQINLGYVNFGTSTQYGRTVHGPLPGVSVFDDRNTYYSSATPLCSVRNPNTGTQMRIKSVSGQGSFMQLEVSPAK